MGSNHVRASKVSGGDSVVLSEVVESLELGLPPHDSLLQGHEVRVHHLRVVLVDEIGGDLDPHRRLNPLVLDELPFRSDLAFPLDCHPESSQVERVVGIGVLPLQVDVLWPNFELLHRFANHRVVGRNVSRFLHSARDFETSPVEVWKKKCIRPSLFLLEKKDAAEPADGISHVAPCTKNA